MNRAPTRVFAPGVGAQFIAPLSVAQASRLCRSEEHTMCNDKRKPEPVYLPSNEPYLGRQSVHCFPHTPSAKTLRVVRI